MEKDPLTRKLAVILHADVVGSTSLVQQGESLAHQRIRAAFQDLSSHIRSYNGSTRELRGDALVAEFERASDAVAAALSFQQDNEAANAAIEDEIKPRLRIGISLGEVVAGDDTITGAGVVLAQRIEQLAEPGGLCISEALHEALPRHLPFELENLGPQSLKGFDDPVQVYRLTLKPDESIPPPDHAARPKPAGNNRIMFASLGAALIAAVAVAWLLLSRQETPDQIAAAPNQKPAIAVLPFDNMSDDPDQVYFSDGISEDLITDLSQLKNLSVIARNSSFSYRDASVKVQEIGADLGADYLLQGSVRKAGKQIRITAQLIDSSSGHQLWAGKFDRELTGIFALQDEITEKILSALSIHLSGEERRQLAANATDNFEAYDLFLQGQIQGSRYTREGLEQAVETFRKVIELDPQFARAYGAMAVALTRLVLLGLTDTPVQTRERALEIVQKAVAINPDSPQVQWALGYVYMYLSRFDQALAALERAVTLSPSYADGYALLALINNNLGRSEEAIRLIEKGMKINPYYSWDYLYNLGRAYYGLEEYEKAVENLRRALERNPAPRPARVFLVASLQSLGLADDAEWELLQLDEFYPGVTISKLRDEMVIDDAELSQRLFDDLRAAGMPD